MTLIIETGKMNHSGKIFDKVSPGITWKVDHMSESYYRKNFGK